MRLGNASRRLTAAILAVLSGVAGCDREPAGPPRLHWYVFDEPSGAFASAAAQCTEHAAGAYRIDIRPLPADADQQREQLVRRLAAGDTDIDLMGMDVIWTAEFAQAGWVLPWPQDAADRVARGRLASAVESASYRDALWAAPFTANAQLLWYRTDRVQEPPATWNEMIETAERLGERGTIQAQGERYEGFTVLFVSLLASAGGRVLEPDGLTVSLEEAPTRRALEVMRRLATSPAADPALSNAREDQARLGFESGGSTFMLNYPFVWPSARANAPELAEHMGWARWPAVVPGMPSRVTLGGVHLGVGAHSRYPELAFDAAACLVSAEHQRLAAVLGGLPPTIAALYDDPEVRERYPFADLLRETLRDGVQRPQTPFYADVSLAISRTLHPMRDIDPNGDVERLRQAVSRALASEGLL